MPARLGAIKREVEALGYRVEPARGGGSHWRVVSPKGVYPLPAHNGLKEQVPDHYVRALCRFLGVDFEGFRSKL